MSLRSNILVFIFGMLCLSAKSQIVIATNFDVSTASSIDDRYILPTLADTSSYDFIYTGAQAYAIDKDSLYVKTALKWVAVGSGGGGGTDDQTLSIDSTAINYTISIEDGNSVQFTKSLDTTIDSVGIVGLGFVAGAHTTDTNIDSTGVAAFGYVAGAHTVNTDNQDASEVDFSPYLSIGSTDTQAAIEELKDEVDLIVAGGGDGLGPDGDKGDITVGASGTTLQIDAAAITETELNTSINASLDLADSALQTEVDGSVTNEIQTLSSSNDTIFLSSGGGFAEILNPEWDSITNIPAGFADGVDNVGTPAFNTDLYMDGDLIYVEDGGGDYSADFNDNAVIQALQADDAADADQSITNELQDFDLTNLSGTTLQLSLTQDADQHDVDLSSLQDGTGTDDQNIDVLTFGTGTGLLDVGIESGADLQVSLDGRYLITEVDGSITNEIQDITITGNANGNGGVVSISGGGTVTGYDRGLNWSNGSGGAVVHNANPIRTDSLQIGDPTVTGYQFPITDGTANQVITTDGNGDLTFEDATGESTTVTDSDRIDFTLTVSDITADIKPSSVTAAMLVDTYLTTEVDGSNTNEIQDITFTTNGNGNGAVVTLSGGGTVTGFDRGLNYANGSGSSVFYNAAPVRYGTLQINDPTSTGFEFPTIDGTSGQVIVTDGAGALSWDDAPDTSPWTADANGYTLAANAGINVASDASYDLKTLNAINIDGFSIGAGGATNNIAIGGGLSSATGTQNVSIGISALSANTSGQKNLAFGGQSMVANTIGQSNVAVGYNTLLSNVSGSYNVALGATALQSNTGSNNIAIGNTALTANSSGGSNTAIGSNAGKSQVTASENTLIGYLAGEDLTSGTNTAIGAFSMQNPTGATNNTVIGRYAMYIASSGQDNTMVGASAGQNNSGSYNVLLGKDAGKTGDGNYNVFIGYDAGENETGSNLLYIDNSNTSSPLLWGDFSANEIKINGDLEATGTLGYATDGGVQVDKVGLDANGNFSVYETAMQKIRQNADQTINGATTTDVTFDTNDLSSGTMTTTLGSNQIDINEDGYHLVVFSCRYDGASEGAEFRIMVTTTAQDFPYKVYPSTTETDKGLTITSVVYATDTDYINIEVENLDATSGDTVILADKYLTVTKL